MSKLESRNITAEIARDMLQRKGVEVSLQQAGEILDFLYKMANIALSIRELK